MKPLTMRAALTRLQKTLGKNACIKDYKRPSSPELRERERAQFIAARDAFNAAKSALDKRRAEVLAADPEYQRLKGEYNTALTTKDNVPHRSFRYCGGTAGTMFFSVKAEADTLEELVQKIEGGA